MRPVVALVEARPETIAEDYGRLMGLAGLAGLAGATDRTGPVTLAAQAAAGGWFPGAGCPPWQIEGVAASLTGAGRSPDVRLAAVDPRGGAGSPAGWGWDEVLAARTAGEVGDDFWTPRPWRPTGQRPHLPADGTGRHPVPAGLAGSGTLGLLAVPSLEKHWEVAAATRLWVTLTLGKCRKPRRSSPAEFLADGIALAREVRAAADPNGTFAVLDGTIWQVGPGLAGRGPVARNILLAGTDPVAVDAVAVRLTGADPLRIPWLKACADRGLGSVRPADIRLAGQTELIDRPFGQPDPAALRAGVRLPGIEDLSWRYLRRPTILRRHRATPWGRLHEEYRAGGNRGPER